MKAPTVSVVMATYNHAKFVAKAIASVLEQRNIDFEFLIADDGSIDETRDVISSINDDRIQFYPNIVNRGACIVTNDLIERAQGEYVALINSDDYWSSNDKLEYQVQILESSPDLGACFGRAQFIDENDDVIEKASLHFGGVFDQRNRSPGEWLRYFFESGNCICHPTMLIRKSCYDTLGLYNNRLRQLPDYDMWVRLVKKYPIYISERELINFRILPGENASSQTTDNSIRTINEHFLIAHDFFNGVSSNDLITGFSDLINIKNIPTEEHLDIEKALLYFHKNQWLAKPYKMVGLHKMYQLLSSPKHVKILNDMYEIDDRWFQKLMSEVEVLRPKIVAEASFQRNRLRNVIKKFLLR